MLTPPPAAGLGSTVAALLAHTQRQLQRHLTGLEQGSHLQAQLPGLLHLSLEAVHAAANLPSQEPRQGCGELCTGLLVLAQGLLRFVQDPARLALLLNKPCQLDNRGTDLIGMLTGGGGGAQQSDATAAASALQRQQQTARLLQKLLEALLQGVLQVCCNRLLWVRRVARLNCGLAISMLCESRLAMQIWHAGCGVLACRLKTFGMQAVVLARW